MARRELLASVRERFPGCAMSLLMAPMRETS